MTKIQEFPQEPKVVFEKKNTQKLPIEVSNTAEPLPIEPAAEATPNEDNQREKAARIEWLTKKAKMFIRIGDNYYKHVSRPAKNGQFYKDILKIAKTTITDDYGTGILKEIQKYDDFALLASHTNYKQVIGTFYNQYHKISHVPKEGNYTAIMSLIGHIFGQSHTDFAIDYLTILYLNPYQRLPILLLESEAKNTGKSTFASFVSWLFEDNVVKPGNNDLQSDFNSVWVQRLAIVIDEAQIDRNASTQMIKRYATETGKVVINEKNKAQREIDFFGKFIFCSNQEGRALFIERGDPRWAVFKVPTFAQKGIKDDPNLDSKIKAEIPAFLHFLANRKLTYKEASRMYFEPKVYETEQLHLYYNSAYSRTAKAIQQLVVDTFDKMPENLLKEGALCFSISDIEDELKTSMRNIDRYNIRIALKNEFELLEQPRGRYTFGSRREFERENLYEPSHNNRNLVHYQFDSTLIQSWKSTITDFF